MIITASTKGWEAGKRESWEARKLGSEKAGKRESWEARKL